MASPTFEQQRLAAVRRFEILDTSPEGAFDRITALAARRFGAPIAIISIVDQDRIWLKSHHGLDATELGRDPGLCATAILSLGPYILNDARADPRSMSNPLVAGDFGLRFYAGMPLTTADGFNLGTLCVIDRFPRSIEQGQIDDLADLAKVVMDRLELRISAKRALGHAELMAREVDHRVMNSLQYISSLLAMQSRQPNAAAAAEQLKVAANRVAAVAQVHRNFYASDAAEASCTAFLRRLCVDLSDILSREIIVTGDEVQVPTTHIQPLGLIVNELVVNAAKHGAGLIEVAYRDKGGRQELTVSDEGPGIRSDFDPLESNGLGMKVLMSLAQQLGATVTLGLKQQGPGACFTVEIPAPGRDS